MDPDNLDTTPSAPPPPGRTPNFIHPESRSYQLYILIAFLSALVVFIGSMRLYTRLRITRSFGVDDFLWEPGGGILGIHLWDAPISHYIEYQKGSLADSVLIRITSTTIKVSFFVFYLRLFGTVTHVRYMVWAGMTVVITFCVVFVILDIIACAPFPSEHGNWVAPSLIDRCNRIAVPLITAGAYISVITDFYILFIPLHQLSKLRVSTRRKMGIGFIFLTGLLAAGSALTNLIIRSDARLFDRSDFTWTIIPVYATSLVEINVGLLCYSMPVVSALFVSGFTSLSRSFGSWIRERPSPRPSPEGSTGESSAHLANGDNEVPHLQSVPNETSSFSGMHISEIEYNLYIKNMQSRQREESGRNR
ncbi:hypothetical protein F4824DRAFT_493250 [Ustulina deusta]|nr:hypothetical protein F4823DRAFT_629600 [Ustulina deusta]KAI3328327.1 hypothetical protein F4824DRAFT_493250 [Ustulina deusta]